MRLLLSAVLAILSCTSALATYGYHDVDEENNMVFCLLTTYQQIDSALERKTNQATAVLNIALSPSGLVGATQKFSWEVARDSVSTLTLTTKLAVVSFAKASGKLTAWSLLVPPAKTLDVSEQDARGWALSAASEVLGQRVSFRSQRRSGFEWIVTGYPTFEGVPFDQVVQIHVAGNDGRLVKGFLPERTCRPPTSVIPNVTSAQAVLAAKDTVQRELGIAGTSLAAEPMLFLSDLMPTYRNITGFRDLTPNAMRNDARNGQCVLVFKVSLTYDRQGVATPVFASVDARSGQVLMVADQRP